jgi:glucose-6-phosphate isomerase
MQQLSIDIKNIFQTISPEKFETVLNELTECNRLLETGYGQGRDMLGWVNLPETTTQELIDQINSTAKKINDIADVIIVIGIGGSYLGAKAMVDALGENFSYLKPDYKQIIFAGQNISEDYISELIQATQNRRTALIAVSKSGNTLEPMLTFRILREEMQHRYGVEGARKRIFVLTDESKGSLREIVWKEGYESLSVPSNVGGRYSVLTSVGLLPAAVAGINIKELIEGAKAMRVRCSSNIDKLENPALIYAAARSVLYREGKQIEILACCEPYLKMLTEWWKQLFGESEGKLGKGLYPSTVTYPSDLHAIGQYIQDGPRIMIETAIKVRQSRSTIEVKSEIENLDKLNYLANKSLSHISRNIFEAVSIAHTKGGVPNISIEIQRLDAHSIGELIYFMERACGISAYGLNVNPFDQPGVDVYKKCADSLLR